MAIAKTDILAFVNTVLRRAETDIDPQLQDVVDDLTDLCSLYDLDETQTLTNASLTLDYPADALRIQGAIIGVCCDTSSEKGKPLRVMSGGWREYLRVCSGSIDSLRSVPKFRIEHDGKIYLYPPPDGDYSTRIWYYKRHQPVASGIEFPDEWKRCIKFGAAAEVAAKYGLGNYRAWEVWNARYLAEKEQRRVALPSIPAIMEGS